MQSLCSRKKDTSTLIANNLRLKDIDFTQYDLDIDRVIIDSSEGVSDEQFIVFQIMNTTYNKDKYIAGE